MKRFVSILMCVALLFSVAALAGCGKGTEDPAAGTNTTGVAAQKFVMGIDPEYNPFSYMGDNGEYTGFDVEVCKAACDYLGWDFDVFAVNWEEKLIQLDANECDCVWSGMTILDSMKDAGYVLSAPYYSSEQVLVVKDTDGYTTSADLEGKDVAVQLGTSGESLLAEDGDLADLGASFGNIVTVESFLKGFTELAGGSVDAVFVDMPVAQKYVSENEGFAIIDEDFGAEEYGIAFRSADQELCDSIEGAVAALVENGTYAEIAAKYPDIVDNLLFLA